MKKIKEQYGFRTKSVHAGEETDCRDGATGDVVVPIHLSTTYVWKSPFEPLSEFEYTRAKNPTRKAYEEKLAAIENCKYGLAFSSGLAAETAVLQSLLRPGDHIVCFDDVYGGTRRLFEEVQHGLSASYVDLTEIENFEKAANSNTKMLWIESPTNPLIKICNIKALCERAHKHGLIVVVDNTFLSPYLQNPADMGADIVLHSSTKYICGHSDVLGGALLTNDDALHEKLAAIQTNAGAVLSPFDSYLNLRGIKTLALRMEQHEKNAMRVAEYLEDHPKVEKVLYPGLPHHPQHELIKSQARGFGGMLSFYIKGDLNTASDFLSRLNLFVVAESLGGVESLIELPALMTHVSMDKEVREAIGITDNLIRVSVGIEDVEDLIDDIEQALR